MQLMLYSEAGLYSFSPGCRW